MPRGGWHRSRKMKRIRLVASEVVLAVLLVSISTVSAVRGAGPGTGGPASSVPTVHGAMPARNGGEGGGRVASESPRVPSANSLITTSGFSGLAYGMTVSCGSGATCTNRAAPPDVQVAVSPNYIVEMVNVIWGVWTKQGSLVKASDLPSFWSVAGDYIGDPKVLYDSQSGRWFASLLDVTKASVMVGASASNDPTGSWYTYVLPASSGNCPDQPILGVNDDKVVVSANDFLPGAKGCGGNFVGV